METSDAVGCNCVSFKTMFTHNIEDILPKDLVDKYPGIDFKLACVKQDDVTKQSFIFLPDMPHLTENIATALELSSSKSSKRNMKYGKCRVI